MEATSARMARDRFGGFVEPATTHLQRYIQNACDPQNYQPNIALNMEIVDLINAKKGSAPREAAIAIVMHTNHRNPNISLLALNLLDNCVKNCGYPFHLQISTKEFLNELVRRFPERPPLRYSRVQSKILELIEEWRQTICQTSKYKDDLGFIRDMHRLLAYKGYMFPEVRREDAAVLNQSETLQSAEEMEEEEKAAQSAKLQELIRRGTPHDLQEANRLMKVMAGYDTRHKTDYRAKAAAEVGKVQQKAKLLEEMLQNHQRGDDLSGEAWEELGNALASAQPRIQKMCEEESEDTEAVAKLFEINDSIHRTLERYRLVKKGDVEGAAKIAKGTLGISGAGVRQRAGEELSLIDFGGVDGDIKDSRSKDEVFAPVNGTQLDNDLLGLSLQGSGLDSSPSISLGGPGSYSVERHTKTVQKSNADILSAFDTESKTMTGTGIINSNPLGSLLMPQSSHVSPPRQPVSRNNLTISSPPLIPSPDAADKLFQTDEEDWTFSSALPNASKEITVVDSIIRIVFLIDKCLQDDGSILINSLASNNTTQPVTEFTFQVAVPKGLSLALEPQSERGLAPQQKNGITQVIRIHGHHAGSGKSVKIRWKALYRLGGQQREEQGELPHLGVSL